MNHRAKFDADGFILAGEIRNRTNTQKTNKQTQAVNDISNPHLAYRHVWIITHTRARMKA